MKSMSGNEASSAVGSQARAGVAVRDDRILPEVRLTAVLVIFVLLVTVGVLYGLPDRTGELFAWKINPQMSAVFLGAGYAGGCWFFIRASLASRWHTIALIFIPTTVFVWLMLGAT